MKLVENWRQWYKMFTNILSMIGIILMALLSDLPSHLLAGWSLLPPEFKASLPPDTTAIIAIVIFILIVVARLIKQYSIEMKNKKEDDTDGSGT